VGETPGPIPNPEAKTHSADGTAPGRVWESRSPPDNHLKKRSRASRQTSGGSPTLTTKPKNPLPHPAPNPRTLSHHLTFLAHALSHPAPVYATLSHILYLFRGRSPTTCRSSPGHPHPGAAFVNRPKCESIGDTPAGCERAFRLAGLECEDSHDGRPRDASVIRGWASRLELMEMYGLRSA
jgi:hypothetical protein